MTFVDGTFGGGGHTRALVERVLPDGCVIGVDLDAQALDRGEAIVEGLPVRLAHASFVAIPNLLADLEIESVDGVLLDLGLSSDQLADSNRGFSFQSEGALDLRFDATEGDPAWRLLEHWSEQRIADVIYTYGEERFSRRIAKQIAETRKTTPIRTATDLSTLVCACVPRSRGHSIHPATRTFQALRIAVNGELDALEKALAAIPNCLRPGGRIAVISFHSLEDRIVKWAFRNDERLTVLTRRPVGADEQETALNPRARSAKLRVAERAEGLEL